MKALVLVEHDGSSVKDATLAAVTAAAKLGEVHLLVAGKGVGGPDGSVVFPHDPCGHATLILNYGGLQRVGHMPSQLVGEVDQEILVNEVAF